MTAYGFYAWRGPSRKLISKATTSHDRLADDFKFVFGQVWLGFFGVIS
jgi:hypothetical protein